MVKWFLFLWFGGLVAQLGDDDFKIRERAMKRADNIVFAYTHHPNTDNVEANRRIATINKRYSLYQLELRICYEQPELFWKVYLIPGRNRYCNDEFVYARMERDYDLMGKFIEAYPNPNAYPYGEDAYYSAFIDAATMRDYCNRNCETWLQACRVLFWYGEGL